MSGELQADVVVVGAGLAGLTAAWRLVEAGVEVVVIEARQRVGGRTVNASIGDGCVVEMGGQWFGHTHPRVGALAAELGVGSFPTYDQGLRLLELRGRVRRHGRDIPRVSPLALLDLGQARARLDRLARTVPAEAPWLAPEAVALDGRSLGTWLDRVVATREARELLEIGVSVIWGARSHEVNLLAALSYISAAGSFDAVAGVRGGMQERRIVGGSAVLSERLASALGGRVHLGRPVRSVWHDGTSVDVVADGLRIRARRAVVAVPPGLAHRLRFEPALPAARTAALARLPMASVTKVAAVFEEPFWRRAGLSGQAVRDVGPLASTFDASPPSGRPGVLIGFVPGERAGRFRALDANDRRREVLDSLAAMFGPEAQTARQYLEVDWSAEEWTRGCYFGLPAIGSLTSVLSGIARPVGTLHWAGAETSRHGYGGMDGAIASGERAAGEALEALKRNTETRWAREGATALAGFR